MSISSLKKMFLMKLPEISLLKKPVHTHPHTTFFFLIFIFIIFHPIICTEMYRERKPPTIFILTTVSGVPVHGWEPLEGIIAECSPDPLSL